MSRIEFTFITTPSGVKDPPHSSFSDTHLLGDLLVAEAPGPKLDDLVSVESPRGSLYAVGGRSQSGVRPPSCWEGARYLERLHTSSTFTSVSLPSKAFGTIARQSLHHQ